MSPLRKAHLMSTTADHALVTRVALRHETRVLVERFGREYQRRSEGLVTVGPVDEDNPTVRPRVDDGAKKSQATWRAPARSSTSAVQTSALSYGVPDARR
jgi:hypothetical protein